MEAIVGDLTPFRTLSAELEARVQSDREFRGEDDPGVRVMASIRKKIDAAIEEAQKVELTITIEEYAKREGITRGAAYKRFQAGGIPGAEKRPGVGLVIPADYAARPTTRSA